MEAIHLKPEPLAYPQKRIKYKHYGKTVELMINKAKTIEDEGRKQQMVQSVANFMKMAYVTWNKDTVADETIIKDLRDFSNGEIQLEENMNLNKVEYRPQNQSNRQNPRQSSKNRQSNRSNQNNQNNQSRQRPGGKRY